MKSAAGSTLPRYRFLSIGQRGVGKTVFLTACYLNAHRDQNQQREFWLEDGHAAARTLLDNVLMYVADHRRYPPATLKVTPIDFVLKQQRQWGQETLGQVQWWDIPGELCHLQHPEFVELLGQADGICLFVEALPVVQNADNPQALDRQFQPLLTLVDALVSEPRLLPLAIVVTKCDQLAPHPLAWQRLQKGLHALRLPLETAGLPHQFFYSEIPLAEKEGVVQLRLNRAGTPIFWLFARIYQQRLPDAAADAPIFYLPTHLPAWIPKGVRLPLQQLFTRLPPWSLFLGLLGVTGAIAVLLLMVLSWHSPRPLTPNTEQTPPMPSLR